MKVGLVLKKNSAPTMKDVAKEAGVALGTVSKVINHIPVGEDYKKRVERAIKVLNYEVNAYARGLKMQHTKTLTLIVPDTRNPFYAAFTHHIESAAYNNGYKLILCCSNDVPQKEIEYLNLASQNKTEGIIALTYSDIGNFVPPHIPIVMFDRYLVNSSIPRVASDNLAGGIMAVNKLIELGCKKPVFIRFHSPYGGESDKRMLGYLEACKIHHIEPDYLNQLDCDDSRNMIRNYISSHINSNGSLSFDGIFTNTDYHGNMTLKILHEMGYRVPDDVQLIGFDGIRKFGGDEEDLFISSICQPIKELARLCVQTVLIKEGETIQNLTLLPVRYEWGGTTRKE